MKRSGFAPTVITILLLVVVGCTSISPAPSPTVGVQAQTQTQTEMVPDTETPSISTATQTLTTPVIDNTAEPTFTLSPTATVCATPSNGITYVVQPGDTLNQIAFRYNMSAEEMQHANCLVSADTIFAGQTIYVPFYLPPVLLQPSPVPPIAAQTLIPADLKARVSFDLGGQNQPPSCDPPASGVKLQITISPRVNDEYELCVYGFPKNKEEIIVKLYAPEDHLVASQKFQVTEDYDGSTVVKIRLWMPVGLPPGWSATAQLASETGDVVKLPFSTDTFTKPSTNTMPLGAFNPFEPHKCDAHPPGSQVVINGTKFGPNQKLPLTIYLLTRERDPQGNVILKLAGNQSVDTNSRGDFSASVLIHSSDLAGTYYVIPDPKAEVFERVDPAISCYKVS